MNPYQDIPPSHDVDFKEEEPETILTFSAWLPFVFGALYGLAGRAVFSGWVFAGHQMPEAMSAGFIFGVPIAIGAITVYLAEKKKRRSYLYYIFAPWLSVAGFIAGTAIALIEGSICIAIIAPLFLALGSVGGLIMGIACRVLRKPIHTVQSICLLPALIALGELPYPLPRDVEEVSKTIHISAPADAVWKNIQNAEDIRPEEVDSAWAYRIGVPKPISGKTVNAADGRVRKVVWEKGVEFDEIITDWDEGKFVRWTYRFNAQSFPAGAMDEHVRIGGEYFDVQDTSYALQSDKDGTALTITIHYRVSTRFNWYANPIGDYLLSDFASSILAFYKNRSENGVASKASIVATH